MDKKRTYAELKDTIVTYEIYSNMINDGSRYEISDGVLELLSPTPTSMHQTIILALQNRLNSVCQDEYFVVASPIDVILSDTEVRQPDLVIIHRSSASIMNNRVINGVPDLVIEVTSEHSRKRDKVEKTAKYARYGILEYWIIEITGYTLEQYILDGERYKLTNVYAKDERIQSKVVPCAAFSMNELIRQMPKQMPDQSRI
jgi:Uma2 family endonuclease